MQHQSKISNKNRMDSAQNFFIIPQVKHHPKTNFKFSAPTGVELYNEDATKLLLNPRNENHKCFDRHSSKFCEMFLARRGRWSQKKRNCEHSSLAFRICRKTCGYCTSL